MAEKTGANLLESKYPVYRNRQTEHVTPCLWGRLIRKKYIEMKQRGGRHIAM